MKEYGLLFYDVPAKDVNLYYRMTRKIRSLVVPLNLSVHIFDWGLKDQLETILTKLGVFTKANCHLIKFDSSSTSELENLASKQLDKIFDSIKARLHKAIVTITDADKKRGYLDRTLRILKQYEKVLTLYEFTRKLQPALDVLKNTINEEYKVLGV